MGSSSLSGYSIDHYHILEQLGQGGMAVVYKAYDTRSERDVAFKIIRSESFAPDVISRIQHRFKREVQTLMRLSHPNIVQILDSGEYEGSPYMVMPLLPGGTLKQKLGSPMPYPQAAGILLPIAQALAHAHQNSVIHRDVKPSNILFTADGQPMLTDFGVVKIIENTESQTLTGTGVGIGTPEYMSPEQGMGKEVDGRSDIYALGVVFYELVTGRKPFTADTPMATVIMHINDPLPRPRQFVLGLPSEVEKLIWKALAKKPDDRFPDMQALAAALDKLIPRVKPAPPPKLEKPVKVKPPRVNPVKPPRQKKEDFTTDVRTAFTKPSTRKQAIPKVLIGAGITAFVGLVITGIILFSNLSAPSADSPAVVAPKETSIPPTPTIIGTPSQTLTPAPTFTITPTQVYVLPADHVPTTKITEDGMTMILIPSIYGEPAFWIDKTEVTIGMYKACEAAGVCTHPPDISRSVYSNSSYSNHAMNAVTYSQAEAYCLWQNKSLPSSHQWEMAAGGYDDRFFPWGNLTPTTSDYANIKLNNNSALSTIMRVGSLPLGDSPFGVQDLIGNVNEWVSPKRGPNGHGVYSAFIKGGSARESLPEWTIRKSVSVETINTDYGEQFLDFNEELEYYRFTGFRCTMPVDE